MLETKGLCRTALPLAAQLIAQTGIGSSLAIEGRYELIDGFKRLGAARGVVSMSHLSARVLEVDDRAAKAAIYGLKANRLRPQDGGGTGQVFEGR